VRLELTRCRRAFGAGTTLPAYTPQFVLYFLCFGSAYSTRDLACYLSWERLQISQRFGSSVKVVLTESLETS
jgi:hypothetical protein